MPLLARQGSLATGWSESSSQPCQAFPGPCCRARGSHSSEKTPPPASCGSTPLSGPGCPCTRPSARPSPKAWAFWCSHDVSSLGCRCPHPPGFHPSFTGKHNSDGSFATCQTACYPQAVQPFLSVLPDPVRLTDWRQLLPSAFLWPISASRIEDGAGTSSSAFWGVPRVPDFLRPLRSLWLKRLETPGPPISPAALRLFESDLRTFLHVRSDDVWTKLMSVDAGQPFRLNLWHCLSVLCCDPDMDFSACCTKVSLLASARLSLRVKSFFRQTPQTKRSSHSSTATPPGSQPSITLTLLTVCLQPNSGSARFLEAMLNLRAVTATLP